MCSFGFIKNCVYPETVSLQIHGPKTMMRRRRWMPRGMNRGESGRLPPLHPVYLISHHNCLSTPLECSVFMVTPTTTIQPVKRTSVCLPGSGSVSVSISSLCYHHPLCPSSSSTQQQRQFLALAHPAAATDRQAGEQVESRLLNRPRVEFRRRKKARTMTQFPWSMCERDREKIDQDGITERKLPGEALRSIRQDEPFLFVLLLLNQIPE